MNEAALLPPGFQDALFDKTRTKSAIIQNIKLLFESMGYEPVDPPLAEFEQSLFTGSGASLKNQTFRILDPLSQKMVGIRADITTQIARIASNRLSNSTQPLRLSYSGDVLRVQGQGLEAKRQLTQSGIELIGTNSPTADYEVLAVSIDALQSNGIKNISIDFTIPRLVAQLVNHAEMDEKVKEKLNYALEKKDIAAIKTLGGSIGKTLATLTAATSIETVISIVDNLPTEEYRNICNTLQNIILKIKEAYPHITITTDLIEYKGYEYHSGICFSLFSTDHNIEVGRGGRYTIADTNIPATGCTLYIDTLSKISPAIPKKEKIYIPINTDIHNTIKLREEGYITVHAVDNTNIDDAAKKLGCKYIYQDNKITEL